ncbi:MAG TPA: zf-HC2 domain-containing protein [Bryobacteraceae bacterium]|jgi:predicted anti-sigma-YlaC factor YlaD|nr:zf-HC2 domain-containing protein [Bryobacteraceae bacterium]
MNCFDSHPSLDSVELHVLGRLDNEEDSEVEEHMLVCSPCRQMADALEREINFIREALLEERPPSAA